MKVERLDGGNVTRRQLDIPEVDALYFTMLNSNKRSLAINTKSPEGKEVMEKMVREADILVEKPRPVPWTAWVWDGTTSTRSTRGLISCFVKGFNDDSKWERPPRSTRTSPRPRAAPRPPPGSGTGRPPSAAPRSATATAVCTC